MSLSSLGFVIIMHTLHFRNKEIEILTICYLIDRQKLMQLATQHKCRSLYWWLSARLHYLLCYPLEILQSCTKPSICFYRLCYITRSWTHYTIWHICSIKVTYTLRTIEWKASISVINHFLCWITAVWNQLGFNHLARLLVYHDKHAVLYTECIEKRKLIFD